MHAVVVSLALFLCQKMVRDLGCPLLVLAVLSLSCVALSQHQDGEEVPSLPLTPPIASAEVEQEGCPSDDVHQIVKDAMQPLIQNSTSAVLPCIVRVKGKVPHCPASSCRELFFSAQKEGLILVSNYYWLVGITGEVRKVYCNRKTQQAEFSSCEDILTINSTALVGVYPIRLLNGTYLEVYCNFTKTVYASCEDLYRTVPNAPPGMYYIQLANGSLTTVFCALYSSCQDIPFWPKAPSGMYLFRLPNEDFTDVYCNNVTGRPEYTSCAHAHQVQPNLPSGTYTIRPPGGSPVTVYCDMNRVECGGGVWTRVASYDYSDPGTTCPGDWNLITFPVRSCGRRSPTGSCASAVFSTNHIEFSSVCGRVIAIQYGSPSVFSPYHNINQRSINDYYVDGVSITCGNPRQHVWTFAGYPSDSFTTLASLCPCSQPSLNVPSPPPFVDNNYFCDTAATTCCTARYYSDDPLWDGQGCGGPSTCCSFNNPPWFSTTLPETTSDDIEVRICDNQGSSADDTPITTLDLYIQ